MSAPAGFTLTTRYLGALPLAGHFAGRMGLRRLLDAWVPADDARLALDPSVVIALMVANLATEPVTSTPEEFGELIKRETAKWGQVVRDAGLQAD